MALYLSVLKFSASNKLRKMNHSIMAVVVPLHTSELGIKIDTIKCSKWKK